MRAHLRDFYPAALAAFGEELAATEALDLLGQSPDPDTAVKLSLAKITAALRHAGRRKIDERARKIQDGLRSEQLRLPVTVQRAYAVTVCSLVAMIATTVEQITMQAISDTGRSRSAELAARIDRCEREVVAIDAEVGELARARLADARHWARHKRPISADALRVELKISMERARELVVVVRGELAALVAGRVGDLLPPSVV